MSSCIDTIARWKQTNRHEAETKAASLSFDHILQFFSASRTSMLRLPVIAGLTPEAQKKTLVFQLYNFLEFLIWAEQGPVTYVCSQLSDPTYPIRLPKDLRDGATIILTQEANHSIWAYSLLLGVNAVSKIDPFDMPPMFVRSMESVIEKDQDLGDLIQLMYVIIAEVIDLGTFEAIRLDPTVQQPVRDFAEDHEFEEKLHRVYFRRLFGEVWSGLPSDLRERIGLLLPEILISLLAVDREMTRLMLGALPEIPDPDNVVDVIVAAEKADGSVRQGALAVLAVMHDIGVFDVPNVARAFRRNNLMPDEFGAL